MPFNNSEIYNNLSQQDKDIVEAILSFLSGRNVGEIKKLLATVNCEIDRRCFLDHQ